MIWSLIAAILVAYFNALPPPEAGDRLEPGDPIVVSMAAIAVGALTETHPECEDVIWVLEVVPEQDETDIIAMSPTCEWAAWFWHTTDAGWRFEVTSS